MIDDVMNRTKVKRGEVLPQSKLSSLDVHVIRQAIKERERLKAEYHELSSRVLAEKFGVHQRTIERIAQGYPWVHVS